jgi:hypothetical protein
MFMSGTFERGRIKNRSPFCPTRWPEKNCGAQPSRHGHNESRQLQPRRSARRARDHSAEVHAHRREGRVHAQTAKRHDFASFHNASKNMGKAILFTSLLTQYAMDLLDTAVADWRDTRRLNPRKQNPGRGALADSREKIRRLSAEQPLAEAGARDDQRRRRRDESHQKIQARAGFGPKPIAW